MIQSVGIDFGKTGPHKVRCLEERAQQCDGFIKLSAGYPTACRMSDNSIGGSGKIVLKEYERGKN